MSKLHEWLPRVLFESVLIVLSILAALALDEWREDREIAELVERAAKSFELELRQNKSRLDDIMLYHGGLLDVLSEQVNNDQIMTSSELNLFMQGFQQPMLLSSAWDTAVATGALSKMDYETVAAISLTYNIQNRYDEMYDAGDRAFSRLDASTPEELKRAIDAAVGFMTDVIRSETELSAYYQQASEMICNCSEDPRDVTHP